MSEPTHTAPQTRRGPIHVGPLHCLRATSGRVSKTRFDLSTASRQHRSAPRLALQQGAALPPLTSAAVLVGHRVRFGLPASALTHTATLLHPPGNSEIDGQARKTRFPRNQGASRVPWIALNRGVDPHRPGRPAEQGAQRGRSEVYAALPCGKPGAPATRRAANEPTPSRRRIAFQVARSVRRGSRRDPKAGAASNLIGP